MKKAHRSSIILLVFAVWVGVSLACASEMPTSEPLKISTATTELGVTQPPAQISLTPADTPTTIETPAIEHYLGDTVQDKGYALTVLSVADPATPSWLYDAEIGNYKFI
jgi:hypothetical protein